IARTLACDRYHVAGAAAEAAVRKIGAPMVPALAMTVREPVDWDLGGMRCVLASLGVLGDLSDGERRIAGMALMSVLYEGYPVAPTRWTRPARAIGRAASVFVTIALT